MEKQKNAIKSKYMNPYLAGVLLGLVLLTAFYISGRGLGASGAIKSGVILVSNTIAPDHTANNAYYSETLKKDEGKPMKTWLVFQMLGVLVGGFISGAVAGRLKLKVEHNPRITSRRRLIFALVGGILFGLGSQLGRGCTSGSALTGMAVISVGGFVTMMFIFGTAYAMAYFVRKNWI
jgi:uncharacterized membrane protein YedE/YeeE